MKITSTLLSIPPYLSTSWKNITALQVRREKGGVVLIISLQNEDQVEIPGLDSHTIDEIFEAHAKWTDEPPKNPLEGPFSFSLPLGDSPLSTMGGSMQHNPDQANLPPLPIEVLKKITLIANAFGLDAILSPPEPNCQCVYCQVARSLQGEEEEVTEADLHFRNWEIEQSGEQLYKVTNPLDSNEHYNVFLGTPLGCTCGSKSCEHIRAVLNS